MRWREALIDNATDSEIANKVACALQRLLDVDPFLLVADANERSIAHRLGVHLNSVFEDWDVDCEYNRDGHEPKKLRLSDNCTNQSDQEEGSRVYPDIIVHRRNSSDNLLVIEVKKSTSKISRDCDLEKLREYRSQLGYKHALFVEFCTKESKPDINVARWIG